MGFKATKEINKYIDHTLLKSEADMHAVTQMCGEAKEYDFASVCVHPCNVKQVASELRGSSVKTCSVIGFPSGASIPKVKAFEAACAIEDGATEIDMVVNIGAIKNADWDLVEDDIGQVVAACKGRALLKVIIETCLLKEEEKIKVCRIAKYVGANYVKTSTGFSTGGATKEDIALMRQVVGEELGVKASGGVRTLEDVKVMIEHGASRIGTSGGVSIINGRMSDKAY